MLKVGDSMPDISLKNQSGELVSLKSHNKDKSLVVYFYPKNNTPGCTAEACSFRDQYEKFLDHGAEVIGISGDSVKSHQQVREKRSLPFVLLSDSKRIAEKAFDVPRNLFGVIPGRVTFIIDHSGTIVHVFDSAANPTKHIKEALKALASI